MNKKEILEWSRQHPDDPYAQRFIREYGHLDGKGGGQGAAESYYSQTPRVGTRILDYLKRAGGEVIDQPSLGAQQSIRGIVNLLSSKDMPRPGYDYPPRTIPGKAARFVGELAAPIAPGMSGAEKVIETAGTHAGSRILANPAVSGAIRRGAETVKSAIGKAGEIARAAYPEIVDFLGGIPAEHVERAIAAERAGSSALKGKLDQSDWNRLADRMIRGIQHMRREAANRIGQEYERLKNLDARIDADQFDDMVIDHVVRNTGSDGVTALSGDDIKMLDMVRKKLKPVSADRNIDAFRLETVIRTIDDMTEYSQNPLYRPSNSTKQFLKGLRGTLNRSLRVLAPEFADAKHQEHVIESVMDTIGKKFNPDAVVNTLRRYSETDLPRVDIQRATGMNVSQALDELDRLLPDSLKFREKARNLATLEWFDSWVPGRPGGSGSRAGAKQHIRQEIVGHRPTGPIQKAAKAATVAAMVPKFHQRAIPAVMTDIPDLARRGSQFLDNAGASGTAADILRWTAPRYPKTLFGRDEKR